jgi:hypothetical protein
MPISTRLYDANHLALGLRAESGVVAEQFDDIILKRTSVRGIPEWRAGGNSQNDQQHCTTRSARPSAPITCAIELTLY